MKVTTQKSWEVIDVTDEIEACLTIDKGVCVVTITHTTAGITTADLDPGTDQDLLDFLRSLVPDIDWRHPHDPDHAPAHLLSSLIGPSVTVPVREGKLILGDWQRIVLVELDGPREREVSVAGVESS